MNFNNEASSWDNERRVKRAKIIAEKMSKAVPIESHYNALEFGCGTGLISFNLYDSLRTLPLLTRLWE